MVSAQQAFTLEIDDVEAAVAEIKGQLNLDELKVNSIGLISCLPDFLESGVVAALQEELPFDLFGQTSIATSATGSSDLDQLSLLVLTADDVEFSSSLSAAVDGSSTEPLEQAYAKAAGEHINKPAFILSYVPLLLTASGDFFVNGLNTAAAGVPFFGALAVDNTIDYHTSRVIYKGEGYANQTALILFYGDVQPRFYVGGIYGDQIINEAGVVTASEGSQLQAINDAPVPEYLKSVGIQANEKGEFIGINTFPYLVDYNDGTPPVVRAMFAVTPEGYAVCGGDIPVGATLGVSYFDEEKIEESSKAALEKLTKSIAENGANAILSFSCVGRYFNLNTHVDAEAQLLHDMLDSMTIPYTFSYSGGEICPVYSKDGSGATTNRAHNCTLIAMVL